MITARRIHAQRAGQPPAPPPPPSIIPYAEHTLALQELTRSYEKRLAAAAADGAADTGESELVAKLEGMVEEGAIKIAELVAKLTEAETAAAGFEATGKATAAQLEAVTADFVALQARLTEAETRATAAESMLDEATRTPEPEPQPAAEAPAVPEMPAPAATATEPKPESKSGKPDDEKSGRKAQR